MERNLILADECQQTADLYPTDFIGQEYAELARRWQALAKLGSVEDRTNACYFESGFYQGVSDTD